MTFGAKLVLFFLCITEALFIGPPPHIRSANDNLCKDCKKATRNKALTLIDFNARTALQVTSRVFAAARLGIDVDLWLPCDVNAFSSQLASRVDTSLLNVSLEGASWPYVPAPRVAISSDQNKHQLQMNAEIDGAQEATYAWVDDVLGAKQLCPYTESRMRAAIGLLSEGVKPGPVRVRVATNATDLVAIVFEEAANLETQPETQVATVLVCAPSLDESPLFFYAICDNIIETTISVLGATSIVGRAWFHPNYTTSHVYNNKNSFLRPGHALPPAQIAQYMQRYYPDANLDIETISSANDKVRHTPHATVNLLRRSQLLAAQRLEARAPKAKPNLIYARNVFRLLEQQDERETTTEEDANINE
mmetsp:Transcript_15568/g.23446  ORF Transcript_15568/g.23446 Transcript_15568/m.23446 type:complete len:363 (-) Transcript_15568:23-1111(-)|eukprot:CAMPEP_0197309228 /NCGR_PEP_ID=MMETSP0891-20130614/7784_1 /TAXON_ID=44058 ORGANISM="Aureoumbra lagunensis, Strain CCMP1510" /NCGR_SAMPLE_ID=MMETSP0891 /ASSEMBLY_ACC=CAM_ASM_000534 /LENGTH=362 /DNA_ID=CAMNT_0042794173 /DNA_START=50 /DNA_END=1138 /DNA_ORIENTATION=+